jgi:excisionase family DNA binding protein
MDYTPTLSKRKPMRLGQAADMLGVSNETLRRWTDEGKVPHFRLPSGERRFHVDDIEAIMRRAS